MNDEICEECGHRLEIGEWPWCPHEKIESKMQGFEPYWDHHLLEEPVFIEGRGHRRQLMRQAGVEFKEASPNDPFTRTWV